MNISEKAIDRFPRLETAPVGEEESHIQAHKVMEIYLKSGANHELTLPYLRDKKFEFYVDLFVEDFRNNLVDLTQFFPQDEIVEGREMFRTFVDGYETKEDQKRKDQKEIDKLEAELAVDEIELEQLRIQMARADEKLARAREEIAKADALLIEQRKLRPIRLAQSLNGIFQKTELSVEQAEEIFSRYLNTGDLTVEENEKGIPFLKINSLSAVTQFFFDHPNIGIKSLDFRHFGHIESAKVQEIADFLKNPATECIKGVAFKEINMSDLEASKAILADLAAFKLETSGKFRILCK